MNSQVLIAAAAALGTLLTTRVIRRLQSLRKSSTYHDSRKPLYRLLKTEEQVVLFIHRLLLRLLRALHGFLVESSTLIEILLLGLWAVWVCREYLDMRYFILPAGREFSSAIQTHHLWTRALECGWCALWNGAAPGGAPAFADPYGSMLYPLVIVTTLIWGVVNGAKISIVLAFWLAGVAQWWIARNLKLSLIARLWSGAVAVVGGHLAGRMELGLFGIVFSTAMTSLLFGGILAAVNCPGKRSAVVLGITGASALLAGQGYLQLAFAGTIPACAFLIFDSKMKLKPVWRTFMLAVVIALLLAAVFLVPFLHFSPHFSKFIDANFGIAQPLKYLPLNFLIDSHEFFFNETLNKSSFPALHTLFLGWVPILLAAYGLTDRTRLKSSTKWYLAGSIVLILAMASGTTLRPLAKIWAGAAGFRHTPLLAGLAVPLVLALAAAGLDLLLRQDWPRLSLSFTAENGTAFKPLPTSWLLILPLVLNVYTVYQFAEIWIYTARNESPVYEVVDALKTDNLQWVQPPFGEHFFIEPAIQRGLKLSPGIIPWRWRDRENPGAYLEASRSESALDNSNVVAVLYGITVFSHPEEQYAAITTENGSVPCLAEGRGGRIEVTCVTDQPGDLIVKEHILPGWKAWLDDDRVPFTGDNWLILSAPAGVHTFTFRYQPWDAALGLLLTLTGVGLCIWLWISADPEKERMEALIPASEEDREQPVSSPPAPSQPPQTPASS
ncbi:MAG: hypothetical protein JXA25_10020 [Anaerolineales bacterium]|nr:hypothetical protein [Anaerolineales bacterium]